MTSRLSCLAMRMLNIFSSMSTGATDRYRYQVWRVCGVLGKSTVNVRGNLLTCMIVSGKWRFTLAHVSILDRNNINSISLLFIPKLHNVHVKSSVRLFSDCQWMNLKGCRRKQLWPSLRYYHYFFLEGQEIDKNNSVSIVSVTAKIWTEHLPNISRKHYYLSQLAQLLS